MTALITTENLLALAPGRLVPDQAAIHAAALSPALAEGDITTPRRIAAFMAQIAHESGGFQHLRELGSRAYFARYEGRKSLGNTKPGDGVRFLGRGYIQITGRYNYKQAGDALDQPLLDNPALAEQPEIAARIAVWFWSVRDLNDLADDLKFNSLTKKINGGLNGIDQRRRYWELAKKIWPED